ncbi:hypothetical protein MSIBF_A220001 [groundwater metagenome]|uniref:Uncharacterized protein n=1 Tax=groundwater metagenome TaxID=717931 RepID=A0A098E8L7_9ZZZZ
MRILIVSGESISKSAGGIGSVVYELCKEFDKRKIFYKVVYSNRFKFETEKGVFIHDVSPTLSPLGPIFGLNFKRFIKKEKDNWDIIHFHLPSAQQPLLFFNNSKSKSIVTFHTTWKGYEEYVYSKIPFRYLKWNERISKVGGLKYLILLEKMALKNATSISTVSSGVKNEINLWYSTKKVNIINNGIFTDEFCPDNNLKKEDKFTILYVGRLSLQKGIFLGIDALANIKGDFNFLVAGEGELYKKLKEYCSKKCVPARFFGRVAREYINKIYSKSDILLMPSLYEGLPVVGIEGACMGLPIVAFEGARVEDIVCEENKQYISRTGDVKALSKSIQYLMENDYERRTIGRKNREIILKNFTAEKMAEKYIKSYEEVMSR